MTHLKGVKIETSPLHSGISVSPVWSGVDRPTSSGWAVKDMKTARRLERAIRAGVAYSKTEVRTDVDGNTYVSAKSVLSGRTMNADLKRVGF